jgi:hypothetical protein
MMAARPFKSLFRGAGRNALDLPVAGLAALAAAFACFAVPQDILSRAVVATGLPSILSAAQPPLGLTARVVLAVGGAAIVFGLVFLLLRLLDRSGMSAGAKEDAEPAPPRLRRRDVHPDAPTPRPISAARDFGEPAPPEAPRAVVPLWLDEAEPVAVPVFEPEPESAFAPEPAFEPEPVSEPEPVFEPEPVAEVQPEPEPVFELQPVAEVRPEPEPVLELRPVAEVQPEPEPVLAPAPEPAPAPQAEMPTSIAELMERLEQGLARRRMIEPVPAAPVTAPQVFPEAAEAPDDRLQSAIASLQRLAARSS